MHKQIIKVSPGGSFCNLLFSIFILLFNIHMAYESHRSLLYGQYLPTQALMMPFPPNLQKLQICNIQMRLGEHIVDLWFALPPVLLDRGKTVETYPEPLGAM